MCFGLTCPCQLCFPGQSIAKQSVIGESIIGPLSTLAIEGEPRGKRGVLKGRCAGSFRPGSFRAMQAQVQTYKTELKAGACAAASSQNTKNPMTLAFLWEPRKRQQPVSPGFLFACWQAGAESDFLAVEPSFESRLISAEPKRHTVRFAEQLSVLAF